MIYSEQDRQHIRTAILDRARHDARITGAAITGSAADGKEDQWSDIDLAFGVREDMPAVLADWTAYMYAEHAALHHLDVLAGPWTYRVFLLGNTLQVDLAFVTETEFRALAPTFRLVFGEAQQPGSFPSQSPESLIGFGWLYAVHARTTIARGKVWQAEYMISALRDTAFTLACLRHGLPAAHAKGVDHLPLEVAASFEAALVRSLDTAELSRAFRHAANTLIREIQIVAPHLAPQLASSLESIASPAILKKEGAS
ncbi:MAG: nucleotidyltransferase domain-containing protein [Acidobacteria bacterium]|nr:nucleotidyltransferase domain-containing protein [Acidobacteriota bacterium]